MLCGQKHRTLVSVGLVVQAQRCNLTVQLQGFLKSIKAVALNRRELAGTRQQRIDRERRLWLQARTAAALSRLRAAKTALLAAATPGTSAPADVRPTHRLSLL